MLEVEVYYFKRMHLSYLNNLVHLHVAKEIEVHIHLSILKRNKMTPHRAEALVYVHSNLRLLSRSTPQYHQEESKIWDVARDEFG